MFWERKCLFCKDIECKYLKETSSLCSSLAPTEDIYPNDLYLHIINFVRCALNSVLHGRADNPCMALNAIISKGVCYHFISNAVKYATKIDLNGFCQRIDMGDFKISTITSLSKLKKGSIIKLYDHDTDHVSHIMFYCGNYISVGANPIGFSDLRDMLAFDSTIAYVHLYNKWVTVYANDSYLNYRY